MRLAIGTIAFVAAMIFAAPLEAQSILSGPAPDNAPSYGIKGGFNFANIGASCDGVGNSDREDCLDVLDGVLPFNASRRGFVIGGFMVRPFTDLVSLQPEVLVTEKGWRFEPNRRNTFDAALTYVEVPVLARIAPSSGSPLSPYLLIGPAFSMRIGATFTHRYEEEAAFDCATGYERDGTFCVGPADLDDSELKGTDVSVVVAGGVQSSRLLLEIRYARGLSNIIRTQDAPDGKLHHKAFSILAGYKF